MTRATVLDVACPLCMAVAGENCVTLMSTRLLLRPHDDRIARAIDLFGVGVVEAPAMYATALDGLRSGAPSFLDARQGGPVIRTARPGVPTGRRRNV